MPVYVPDTTVTMPQEANMRLTKRFAIHGQHVKTKVDAIKWLHLQIKEYERERSRKKISRIIWTS